MTDPDRPDPGQADPHYPAESPGFDGLLAMTVAGDVGEGGWVTFDQWLAAVPELGRAYLVGAAGNLEAAGRVEVDWLPRGEGRWPARVRVSLDAIG